MALVSLELLAGSKRGWSGYTTACMRFNACHFSSTTFYNIQIEQANGYILNTSVSLLMTYL